MQVSQVTDLTGQKCAQSLLALKWGAGARLIGETLVLPSAFRSFASPTDGAYRTGTDDAAGQHGYAGFRRTPAAQR